MTISTRIAAAFSRIKDIPFIRTLSKLPKKAIWGIAAIFIVLVAGGAAYYYYQAIYLPSQVFEESTLQTAVASRGDLTIYASGTGTLISASETNLAFKTEGQVTQLLVEVGSKVAAGDLLAQVDDTDAQTAYVRANRTYLELTSPSAIATAQQTIAEATTAREEARSTLAYLISPEALRAEDKVAEKEAAVKEAQAVVDQSPSDAEAKKTLEKAAKDLETAQAGLVEAQAHYQSYYIPKYFKDGVELAAPTEAEILAARAEVKIAEATLVESQYLYAALTGGEIPENATGSGLTELEQAELDLETAQADLEGTRLISPISGTIMSIDISVGDSVSSGTTAITVADLSQPYLEVYLDESDWVNVKADYETEVIFDILPDTTFSGVVTQVDPGLYSENNTSVVRALVKLTAIDESTFNLPLGTTASVDVIGGRATDAVLVPIEALHQAGDKYAVFVMENGKPVLRMVEVGIQDVLYAEIISGVEQGDVVTTGITATK